MTALVAVVPKCAFKTIHLAAQSKPTGQFFFICFAGDNILRWAGSSDFVNIKLEQKFGEQKVRHNLRRATIWRGAEAAANAATQRDDRGT